MPATLTLKGGLTADEDLRVGALKELTVDTEAKQLRLHDAVTPGGKAIGGSSALTTKGDIATFATTDVRLPVGADNQVLTADAAEATGVKWATPAAGAGMPAGVYEPFGGSDYMCLPHNVVKFSGGVTNATANEATWTAAWFMFPTLITDIGIIVRTADAGATDTRVSIYAQHATTALPDALVFASDNLDVSATGYVPAALPANTVLHGLYWFGFKSDSTTLNVVSTDNTGGFYWGHPLGMGNGAGRALLPRADALIGAWPATATIDGSRSVSNFQVVGFNGN